MAIRLNQVVPPRFVAALGLSLLLVVSSLVAFFLIDSCRDWVSIFFVKQVARIHFHETVKCPYRLMVPSFLRESIQYDPIDRKYMVRYSTGGPCRPTSSSTATGLSGFPSRRRTEFWSRSGPELGLIGVRLDV
jgi:hypothetical protein